MNPHKTALAFAHALAVSSRPELVPVHIYAHDTEILPDGSTQAHVQEIQLPGVFVRVTFEPLAGSKAVGKAKVEVDIESQADDDNSETHAGRETAVRAVLNDMDALTAAFEAAGGVQLLGRPCITENGPDVENRAFKTTFTYKAGVQDLGV